MPNWTPVTHGLIPAEFCLVPCVPPYGSDVLVNGRFRIRGWGETGLHVGSACCIDSSLGSLGRGHNGAVYGLPDRSGST